MIGSVNDSASLAASQTKLLTALRALSTGSRINSAADNPAGSAQSQSYSVQLSSTAQAANNIQYGTSLLDTASGSLTRVTQSLEDIRTLTVQAGNGALGASDLQSIQSQINQITQGIDQIVGGTQFNGKNLLDGSFSQSIQTGINPNSTLNISIGNLSTSSLGISGLDVTTSSGQSSAFAALDHAMLQVNNQSANLGAMQAGLNSTATTLGISYENIASSKSALSDTNYAQTASDLAQANIQNQAALHALATYNSMQNNLLTLLPK